MLHCLNIVPQYRISLVLFHDIGKQAPADPQETVVQLICIAVSYTHLDVYKRQE